MKRRTHAFSFFLLVMFIMCAVIQFLAAGDIRVLMLDTDALNIPTVVDNVIAHHGSLSHWYLSPAPYLFPDALIHSVIHPFATSTYMRLAVFAAVQIALLFLVLWWLAVRTLRNHPLAIAVAITGNLTWMALLRGSPYNQLMTAGFHYGAFLMSIAVIALAVGTTRRINWAVIGIVCFLTTLNDNIFAIQTTIPLVLMLILVAIFDAEHRMYRLVVASVAALSTLIGSVAYGLVITHQTRYPVHLNGEKFRANAHAVRSIVSEFLRHHEPIALALLLTAVIAAHFLIRLVKRIRRTTPMAMLALFACASMVSTCVGLVLATTNEMTIRYFIPVFSWPVIIGGLVIFNTDMIREKVPVIVASVTALMLCLNTSTLVDLHGIDRDYYPADIACIDTALPAGRALHGIANYWDAKYIQSFSKRDLTVAQYRDNLTPMKWITTDDYYRSSYDFAVISTTAAPQFLLSRELIMNTYGEPSSSSTCGTRIVLVYKQGE
jgi:hypothetical protein